MQYNVMMGINFLPVFIIFILIREYCGFAYFLQLNSLYASTTIRGGVLGFNVVFMVGY